MVKELIEDKLYQIIDQFSEMKITNENFYSILLNEVHLFYDGNVRTCKILFGNDNERMKQLVINQILSVVLRKELSGLFKV